MNGDTEDGDLVMDDPSGFAALRTGPLASAFRSTSTSYKFYWFLALVDTMQQLDGPIPVERVIRAMVVRAWFTVAQYRLSLGLTDRLQQCVYELQAHAGLGGSEPGRSVEAAIENWSEWSRWAEDLARFVPGRFLGAWYPDVAQSRPYDRRGARDVAIASAQSWGTADEGPYRLYDEAGRQMIEMSNAWRDWLAEHGGLALGYTQLQLSRYLQARNPGVPGIVDKLAAPGRRQLAAPRRWWIGTIERGGLFATDLYTGGALAPDFDLDHFLPWNFVAHDEPWNLVPTSAAVNRSKGDKIPDIPAFLSKLARLHAGAIATGTLTPAMARSYSEFLRLDIGGPLVHPATIIMDRYEERIAPLAQIATSQGFPSGWRPAQ